MLCSDTTVEVSYVQLILYVVHIYTQICILMCLHDYGLRVSVYAAAELIYVSSIRCRMTRVSDVRDIVTCVNFARPAPE